MATWTDESNKKRLQTWSKNGREIHAEAKIFIVGETKEQREKRLSAERNRIYRLKNKEKIRERQKLIHDPKSKEYKRKWYLAHRESELEKKKRNHMLKPWVARNNSMLRKHRIRICTPKWLTRQHRKQIQDTHLDAVRREIETGIPHHVDHIIPVKHDKVCGLHVPWNLQVIPATENMKKKNVFDLDQYNKSINN